MIEYIASVLCNPIAAEKLRKEIASKIELIKVFSERFPEFDTEEKTKFAYRKAMVKNYYILYHFDNNENKIIFQDLFIAKWIFLI